MRYRFNIRKYVHNKLAFFLIGIILTISYPFQAKSQDSALVNIVVNDTYEVKYKKRDIPTYLKSYSKIFYDIKFRIANPKRKYNATDVSSFHPNRRLIFIAIGKNAQIVFYEKGGRGKHNSCLIGIQKDSLQYVVVWNVLIEVNNLNELLEAIGSYNVRQSHKGGVESGDENFIE